MAREGLVADLQLASARQRSAREEGIVSCPPAGDSLFPGGVGKKENFESLINDVEHKLFDRLPDETWFYPGHGNDSTLGNERASIPEWRERGW